VVPSRSVLGRLEGIGFGISGSERTFRYSRNTIILTVFEHSHAMPMNACAIRLHFVCHGDFDGITPIYPAVREFPGT
jgi:hypothetical protein